MQEVTQNPDRFYILHHHVFSLYFEWIQAISSYTVNKIRIQCCWNLFWRVTQEQQAVLGSPQFISIENKLHSSENRKKSSAIENCKVQVSWLTIKSWETIRLVCCPFQAGDILWSCDASYMSLEELMTHYSKPVRIYWNLNTPSHDWQQAKYLKACRMQEN